MWALGICLYELLTLKPAFRANSIGVLIMQILSGVYPPVPTRYSAQVAGLVSSLLQANPEHRPTARRLLGMGCLRGHVAQQLAAYGGDVAILPGGDAGSQEDQGDHPATVHKQPCDAKAEREADPATCGVADGASEDSSAGPQSDSRSSKGNMFGRIEALREYLEAQLGEHVFVATYRMLKAAEGRGGEEGGVVCAVLAPDMHPYMHMIIQLIHCEAIIDHP
jgi:hypothetical protein